jgi:membrane carboxypeptidase/penicillin-binding protein PbpC
MSLAVLPEPPHYERRQDRQNRREAAKRELLLRFERIAFQQAIAYGVDDL